jgi:hypothetical protein
MPGGGSGSRVLPFIMQNQQQTQWCWAATSVSVNAYFKPGTTWTQCLVVNNALNTAICCSNGSSSTCDNPWFLDRALRIVGNLHHLEVRRGTLAEVTTEIAADRPLCLRIGWFSGGGHFVGVYGYSGTIISVGDPWWGDSVIDYSDFPENYQSGGNWTHTYWVVD